MWGAAEAQREVIGSPIAPVDREQYGKQVAEARQAVGENAFSAVWAKGRAMTMEQAIALVLA
jgi:hypothetical protein